jgi:hypothetical protein
MALLKLAKREIDFNLKESLSINRILVTFGRCTVRVQVIKRARYLNATEETSIYGKGYFQDEKEMKNVEANLVAMHIQSLEMKLAGSDRLHEKINRVREEFAKSEVDHLSLK